MVGAVIVFRDEATYTPYKPLKQDGKVDVGVQGYFESGQDVNYITVTIGHGEDQAYRTIFHEYVHFVVSALYPKAEVPTLVLPDHSIMTESAAMMIHIADSHPAAGMSPALDSAQRPQFLRAGAAHGLVCVSGAGLAGDDLVPAVSASRKYRLGDFASASAPRVDTAFSDSRDDGIGHRARRGRFAQHRAPGHGLDPRQVQAIAIVSVESGRVLSSGVGRFAWREFKGDLQLLRMRCLRRRGCDRALAAPCADVRRDCFQMGRRHPGSSPKRRDRMSIGDRPHAACRAAGPRSIQRRQS